MLNRWVVVGFVLAVLLAGFPGAPALAQGTTAYIVQPGDTLAGIAARYGLTVTQVASANGLSWNAWVFVGQSLVIPGGAPAPAPSGGGSYVVQRGDTLAAIAARFGTTVAALVSTNGLWNANFIYVGQLLAVPAGGTASPAPPPAAVPDYGTRWIDVNLSTQTLVAYSGQTPVFQTRVSTGTSYYPTVAGTYSVYVKYTSAPMSGPGYYLPDVPYIMYFYSGYGLHGTYWHSNFGTPMSHGCVNLSIADAEWLFNWAEVGTTVVTHY